MARNRSAIQSIIHEIAATYDAKNENQSAMRSSFISITSEADMELQRVASLISRIDGSIALVG
jgi:hypothetical protein